jgi:hypothetical protein
MTGEFVARIAAVVPLGESARPATYDPGVGLSARRVPGSTCLIFDGSPAMSTRRVEHPAGTDVPDLEIRAYPADEAARR